MFLPKVQIARNATWHDDTVTDGALGGKDSNVQDTQVRGPGARVVARGSWGLRGVYRL